MYDKVVVWMSKLLDRVTLLSTKLTLAVVYFWHVLEGWKLLDRVDLLSTKLTLTKVGFGLEFWV